MEYLCLSHAEAHLLEGEDKVLGLEKKSRFHEIHQVHDTGAHSVTRITESLLQDGRSSGQFL